MEAQVARRRMAETVADWRRLRWCERYQSLLGVEGASTAGPEEEAQVCSVEDSKVGGA